MSKNYKNIDDLFRDKFKDFEPDPPGHVWENIKQNIHGQKGSNPGKPFTKGGIAGISAVLIVAGLFMLYQFTGSSDENRQVNVGNNNYPAFDNNEKNSVDKLLASKTTQETKDNTATSDLKNISDGSEKNIRQSNKVQNTQTTVNNFKEPELTIEDNNNKKNNTSVGNLQSITENNPDKSTIIADIADNQLLIPGEDSELLAIDDKNQNSNNSDELSQIKNKDPADMSEQESETGLVNPGSPDIRSDYGKPGDLLFGLYFTPEMIFYPSDNKLTNYCYSLDLNGIYRFSSGYMIQSGLGIARSTDDGNYKVDYNEFLGTYEDVYDITFDTTQNGFAPIYHTETVSVYDSITHITITPTKNRYTYIQIPLFFGYGNQYKRFGWFVKGGPSLSILIHENKPDVNIPYEYYKILNVENEVPARIKTYWQFAFSGGVSYRLSNHLSISLEPMIRYYLNSAYERNKMETKHPYSFGLRTGFLLNF